MRHALRYGSGATVESDKYSTRLYVVAIVAKPPPVATPSARASCLTSLLSIEYDSVRFDTASCHAHQEGKYSIRRVLEKKKKTCVAQQRFNKQKQMRCYGRTITRCHAAAGRGRLPLARQFGGLHGSQGCLAPILSIRAHPFRLTAMNTPDGVPRPPWKNEPAANLARSPNTPHSSLLPVDDG